MSYFSDMRYLSMLVPSIAIVSLFIDLMLWKMEFESEDWHEYVS